MRYETYGWGSALGAIVATVCWAGFRSTVRNDRLQQQSSGAVVVPRGEQPALEHGAFGERHRTSGPLGEGSSKSSSAPSLPSLLGGGKDSAPGYSFEKRRPEEIPGLVAELRDTGKSGAERDRAALEISAIGAAAVPALAELLTDADVLVRQNAAAGLARLGRDAKEAADPLAKALDDEDPIVRDRATDALRKIGRKPNSRSTPP